MDWKKSAMFCEGEVVVRRGRVPEGRRAIHRSWLHRVDLWRGNFMCPSHWWHDNGNPNSRHTQPVAEGRGRWRMRGREGEGATETASVGGNM